MVYTLVLIHIHIHSITVLAPYTNALLYPFKLVHTWYEEPTHRRLISQLVQSATITRTIEIDYLTTQVGIKIKAE